MKLKNIKYLLLCVALGLMSFIWLQPPVKIYMIGDSTMCLYPTSQLPINGWGMPFSNYFDPTITIDNRAKAGRSTRTFLAQNRWQPIADSLKAGDYVLMQFGHNDEGALPQYADRHTDVPDYKISLIKFITETQAKNAIPILITPISRRSFDANGNAKETHTEYTKAVFEVGAQYHVTVIDLDKKSRELFQQLGPVKAKLLFMELDSAEHPNYPLGRHDGTHFNEYGARKMAEIVINDIKAQNLPLANRLVKGANAPTVNPQAK